MKDFYTIKEALLCYKECPDFNEFTVTKNNGHKVYYCIVYSSRTDNVYARRLY